MNFSYLYCRQCNNIQGKINNQSTIIILAKISSLKRSLIIFTLTKSGARWSAKRIFIEA